MSHLILIGDSIFDNASYVQGGPPVIEQLRSILPPGTKATLLAIDGSVITDVVRQLSQVPDEATHIFVSVGGNDALGYGGILLKNRPSSKQLLEDLADVQNEFRQNYRKMLARVMNLGRYNTVCTIYDSVPGLTSVSITALSIFNDVIVQEASFNGIPGIDLRHVCSDPSDYSTISPIEPSALGGDKIAKTIAKVFLEHDFSANTTAIYT
jgi:hypothetical protein